MASALLGSTLRWGWKRLKLFDFNHIDVEGVNIDYNDVEDFNADADDDDVWWMKNKRVE